MRAVTDFELGFIGGADRGTWSRIGDALGKIGVVVSAIEYAVRLYDWANNGAPKPAVDPVAAAELKKAQDQLKNEPGYGFVAMDLGGLLKMIDPGRAVMNAF
jgi:hypothetical protein